MPGGLVSDVLANKAYIPPSDPSSGVTVTARASPAGGKTARLLNPPRPALLIDSPPLTLGVAAPRRRPLLIDLAYLTTSCSIYLKPKGSR